MKNNTNNISTEELLRQLKESNTSVNNIAPLSDQLKFIQVFNLKPGNESVTPKALHSLYLRWSQTPVTRKSFFLEINNFFEKRTSSGKTYYLLNIGPIQVAHLTAANKIVQDKTKMPSYKRHFETFLKKFNLTKGTFQLKTSVAYDLYDKWQYDNGNDYRNPLSAYVFDEFMKLYFNHKLDYPTLYIGVDRSILNILTDEQKLQCLSPKGQRHASKKEKKQKI